MVKPRRTCSRCIVARPSTRTKATREMRENSARSSPQLFVISLHQRFHQCGHAGWPQHVADSSPRHLQRLSASPPPSRAANAIVYLPVDDMRFCAPLSTQHIDSVSGAVLASACASCSLSWQTRPSRCPQWQNPFQKAPSSLGSKRLVTA